MADQKRMVFYACDCFPFVACEPGHLEESGDAVLGAYAKVRAKAVVATRSLEEGIEIGKRIRALKVELRNAQEALEKKFLSDVEKLLPEFGTRT